MHRSILAAALAAALSSLPSSDALAASVEIPALDSGFVTALGGSAKGDGTVAPGAKYNYSVGYELHYGGGFLFSPLAPTDRRNYFVFDLGGITTPIVSAALKLWTGTLESADAFETYVVRETTAQPAALAGITTLATLPMSAFDGPGKPGVATAASLYPLLSAGTTVLASVDVAHGDDDSFLALPFTTAGVAHLNGLRLAGGPIVLAGLVTTVDTVSGTTPQQPFGFTGPDIPAGGPLVPLLIVATVPEPAEYALFAVGLGVVAAALRRRSGHRGTHRSGATAA